MSRTVLVASVVSVGVVFASLGRAPSSNSAAFQPTSLHAEGLHNLYQLSPRIYSGGSPEGDAGFESLRRLGVRTVISVDGAVPEVTAAAAHGLRYVHVPIGYDGVPRDKGLLIAKAVRDLPGPVYIHCHHGKHRGPAAAVCAMVAVEERFTPRDASEWLKLAGTDPRYQGLYAVPHGFSRPTPQEYAATPPRFPEATPPSDLTQAMIRIDELWDRIKKWRMSKSTPPPIDEVVQIGEHYRELSRSSGSFKGGDTFLNHLLDAEAAARELEHGLRDRDDARIRSGFEKSQAACTRCHAAFRD